MAKTLEQLLSLSSIIANETKAGANTALRVGGLFSDIIYYLRDLDYADKDDIPSLEGYATEQWVLGKGYATTSDLDTRIDALVNGAPAAYDTLKEIADVLAGNVNSISDILTALGNKADKATTLSGYGITDAYTIAQIDGIVNGLSVDISTLEGYFTDGVANSALRLSDNGSYTAWGQTFFTNGKPKSVSGALTDVTDITSSGTITTNKIIIGNGAIEWDEANKGFKVTGLYSTTYLSAKGANTNGGSTPSGNQYTRLDTWDGYTSAMDGWVLSAKLGKGLYDTQNSLITRVGALEGKATNVSFTQSLTSGTQIGSISIDGVAKNIYAPTIPTDDINKGVTAYGWGNHASVGYAMASALSGYLPLSGGTIDGSLQIGKVNNTSFNYILLIRSGHGVRINNTGSNAYFSFGGTDASGDLTYEKVLMLGDNGLFYSPNGSNYYGIIHSGNYTDYTYSKSTIDTKLGEYQPLATAINKDNIGNQIVDGITTHVSSQIDANGDISNLNSYYNSTGFRISRFTGLSGLGTQNVDGLIVNWPLDHRYGQQWYIDDETHTIQVRYVANAVWKDWKTIAFTDSNVASATKLSDDTAYTAWGQTFFENGKPKSVSGVIKPTSIKTNHICIECDNSGANAGARSSEINNYDDILYIQWASPKNLALCGGGGNVGIGTTSTQYKLDVRGVIYSNTGIFSDGYVSAKGQNTSSDMRLKNVLSYVVLSVKDIANAPSVRFAWKNGGGVDVGSSAQYWQGLLPDAVKERDGMLEMQYANIALLSAIALARNFETMDERVTRLENENKELRNEISMMKGGHYA